MQIEHSKHLQKIVEAEQDRIRAEIIGAAFKAFRDEAYRVTISHDQDNTTERTFKTAAGALAYALEGDAACDRFWMFAYSPASPDKPAHWAFFVTPNDVDVLNDYSVSAETILAPVNAIAARYY